MQPVALVNQMVMTSFGVLFVPMVARLFARGDHEGQGLLAAMQEVREGKTTHYKNSDEMFKDLDI